MAGARHPLYQMLLESMRAEKVQPAPVWRSSLITPADLQIIQKQCEKNEFDCLNLRNSMYEAVAKGNAQIFASESDVGRVITITDGTADPTPLQIWGRLIRIFGQTPAIKPQVIWFASRHNRFWPPRGEPVGHAHINGGYCMPCEPNTVVIYRYEDATRVLIHELLHGFCTDSPLSRQNPIEFLETRTEAWAEIILAAAREVGIASPRPLPSALTAQLEWIALQNERLRREHRVVTPTDYAWRYTIGKEDALRQMGFSTGPIKKYRPVLMRLTPPISQNDAL